jgi:hypothetical protein
MDIGIGLPGHGSPASTGSGGNDPDPGQVDLPADVIGLP